MLVRTANTILTTPKFFWPKRSAINIQKKEIIKWHYSLKRFFSFQIVSHWA